MPAAVRRLAALGVDAGRPPAARHPLPRRAPPGRRAVQARARARRPPHGAARRARRRAPRRSASRSSRRGSPSFEPHDGHVAAAGIEARYLVAADGLHSTIRRALERERRHGWTAAGRGARSRGTAAVRPAPALPRRAVDRPGRGVLVGAAPRRTSRRSPPTWSASALLVRRAPRGAPPTDGREALDGRRLRGPPRRVPRAARTGWRRGPGQRRARRRAAAAGRPPPGLRPGAAGRRRVRLPGRSHRRGHRRRPRPGRGARGAASRPAAPPTTSAPGGASPARPGGSPRACCGRATSRCSRRASSPPRSPSPGSSRPSSTTPPRPRKSRPIVRAGAWPRPFRAPLPPSAMRPAPLAVITVNAGAYEG